MLFVRTIVHVTMPKLYFSWSYLHFLSWLSLEIAHSSNSVPHPPFFLLSLSCCRLTPCCPFPSPHSPLPPQPLGPICHCLPLHQLIPFYFPLSLSGGRGSPTSSTPSPAIASFFFFLHLLPEPIWTLLGLYFSCKTMKHRRKERWLLWHKMAMIFFRLCRKLVKMIFFSFETAKPALFAYVIKNS